MPEDIEPLTDSEIMDKVKKFRTDGMSGSTNRFDRMRKSEDFAIGINQWDKAVEEANRLKGKFSLTVPIIGPQVNSVTGGHIQNPQDFKTRPLRGGTTTIAQLLTSLTKHATDTEYYLFQETQQFKSGVSSGEGDLLFSLDFSEDPKHANLMIEKLNEHQVMWDPSCIVYNPNHRRQGAKYVIWEPWIDKDLMHEEYPDNKEDLQASGGQRHGGLVMGAVNSIINFMVGSTRAKTATIFGSYEREDIETVDKYRYHVNHTWWRWPKRVILLYDARKSEIDAKLLVKDEDIKKARDLEKQFPDTFEAVEVIRNIMHHTIRVGDVFLEDRVGELGECQQYPISRFHAYYDNGYMSGISEKLIGTQEVINFSYSAQLNILKKMPNSGWIIGADPTGEYKRELEDHSGEDGFVAEMDKAGNRLEKIQPNDLPVGFNVVTEQAIEHSKMITGIRTEDPTTEKDRVASAILLKQRAAAKDQAIIHRNWNYTQSIAGNLITEIIRFNEIYSEDEIREIVDENELIDKTYMQNAREQVTQILEESGAKIPEDPPTIQLDNMKDLPQEVQQAAMNQYQQDIAEMKMLRAQIDTLALPLAQQMLLEDIKNVRKGKYNTKVTLSPASETARIARSFELTEVSETLIKTGQQPIPGRFVLEASDLANKDEIIEAQAQQAQAMAQAKAG